MRDNQMYKNMVVYADTPEAASLFVLGYEDMNVYMVSASDS